MKQKLKPSDGLGPYEVKKIRAAIRLVWQRCHARKLVIKRCTKENGYTYCEKCKKRCPKLKVDHITQVGDVDADFIIRLFCPSTALQGLCDKCHKEKTKMERLIAKEKKRRWPDDKPV